MATPERPDRIGSYTILDVLGEGGMGVVYLAEQHEPVRRTVALKVLKAGEESAHVVERFDKERQALAVMDHPAIAKVFDAGVTPDGRSYFAMERVHGEPITRFCDERQMRVRDRVRLFAEVCRAVQHAHQKGLIHRDLKPSNVLVSEIDGRPHPRIIDFGIAKAVEADEFEGTRLTRDDQIVGTPAYMSPEQIEGSADIDTRSDIYALGVLLHELLVGVLPYDVGAYRGWAALAATLHRDPATLAKRFAELSDTQETVASQRGTTVAALRSELGGDLGFIVARAMEKDRAHRYETANGLALDLERYLAFEPVRATGAGTAYVLRKFVRRHRLAVGFGVTVAVGLVAFSVVTAVQAGRISRARDEAEARREQAEGLIDFMLTDLRDKLEPIGRLDLLEDLGTAATAYFASLPEQDLSEEELLRRSQALYQIGENKVNAGDLATAAQAFSESLRLAQELSRRTPDDTERLYALGQSYFWAGYVPYLEGDLDVALSPFQRYLDVSERLVELDPQNLDFRLELSYARSNIGSVREAMGDLAGAEEAFSATLSLMEELTQEDPENLQWRLDLAFAHNTLGFVLWKQGKLAEARDQHEAELALKTDLVARDPDNVPWRRYLALGHHYFGVITQSLGEEEEALGQFGESLRIHRELVQVDPDNAEWQRGLGLSHRHYGLTLLWQGSVGVGEDHLRASVRILEDLVSRDPTSVDWIRVLTQSRSGLAAVLLEAGHGSEALGAVRTGIAALAPFAQAEAVDAATRIAWAEAHLVEGQVLTDLGRRQDAEASWGQVLQAVDLNVAMYRSVELLDLEARALTLLGRRDEARSSVEDLLAMGYRHPDFMRVIYARSGSP